MSVNDNCKVLHVAINGAEWRRAVNFVLVEKRRRKSLYGKSCSTERLVLQNVLACRQLSLNSSRDLNNPDAILCLLCQRHLLKVKKLEEEIKSTVAELYFTEIFKVKENRTLQSYSSQPLMSHIKWANIQKWLKEKFLNLDVY